MLFWVVLYGIYYHRAFFESIILHHAPFKFCRLLQVMFLFQNVYKLAVLLLALYALQCALLYVHRHLQPLKVKHMYVGSRAVYASY